MNKQHAPSPLEVLLPTPDTSFLLDGFEQLQGNTFIQDMLVAQAGGGGGGPATCAPPASDYTSRNGDPALEPLQGALNDDCLSFADRARLVVDYRDQQITNLDFDGLKKLHDMKEFDKDNPLTLSGPKAGMHHNLYAKLADDPKMQQMMLDLSERVAATDQADLDINQLYMDTVTKAGTLAADGEDPSATNLRALQAMATLANFNKFPKDELPPELADKLPPKLWDKIQTAGKSLQQSDSPDAAVMSHGVPAKIVTDPDDKTEFTADHNYHFFSHAYLTASLMQEHGMGSDQAMALSGLVGAQYELKPGSLGESQGNSAIKDVLMNAEGAAFGADSMVSNPMLPSTFDGPQVENRQVRDMHPKDFPEDVKEIVDEAKDPYWDLAGEGVKEGVVEGVKQVGKTWRPPWMFLL